MNTERENTEISFRFFRSVISFVALIIALAHLIWPELTIDGITLGLIVIAVLPWLAPLVKSLELPGGWKIELNDLQKTASRAETAGLLSNKREETPKQYSFELVADADPNLALAGLRIEIEKQLTALAEARGIDTNRFRGVGKLLGGLEKRQVFTAEERSILADLIGLLNNAVHGASVDYNTSKSAIQTGLRLLATIDERIENLKGT
jgi:hypothetical protein